MRTSALWLAASAAALIASVAAGQASSPSTSPRRTSAGATLASQGAPGIAPCASCHGAQGEGNAAAGFPRLTGQPAAYLLRQLEAYAADTRTNPVMQPIAKAMSAEQRGAAAGYYESLAVSAAQPASAAAAAAPPLGKTIATVGIQERRIQACANCHGPEGIGEWATYPALAGQHSSYLANALAEWKSGARRTDPSGQMPSIAKTLSDAEAQAVVAYYASLPPPSAAARAGTEASGAKQRQTVVSGPTSGPQTGSTQGVGTEQGAPLAGSTQGTGGPGNPNGPQSGVPTGRTGGAAAGGASAPR